MLQTAEHYLEEDGPTAFTPRGLDILPKLSKCCDTISVSLQQEIDQLNKDIAGSARTGKYNLRHGSRRLVSSLSARTKPADVDRLSQLTEGGPSGCGSWPKLYRPSSKQKAHGDTRFSYTPAQLLLRRLRPQRKHCPTMTARRFSDCLWPEAKASAEAAVSWLPPGRFDASFLPRNTGGNVWARKRWEAARAYSTTVAYDGREFPVTTDGAKCVLCQRDLDEDAVNRLAAFDSFCKDWSQQLAEGAAKRREEAS